MSAQSAVMRSTTVALLSFVYSFATTGCGQSKTSYGAIERVYPPPAAVKVSAKDANGVSSGGLAGSSDVKKVLAGELPNPAAGHQIFTTSAEKKPIHDFVFVVDNSISMAPLIGRFVNGFDAIPASEYPENARLAVMNTMPAVLNDLNTPRDYLAIDLATELSQSTRNYLKVLFLKEPGFLKFINQARVADYKSATQGSDVQYKFPIGVCEAEWFLPSAKNSVGVSCLKAAMQISGETGIEAGLTAIAQMMSKNVGNPLFRSDAIVHFVFVSDTHDPGANLPDYIAARPDFSKIKAAVQNNSSIAGVKLHGVVPNAACSSSEGVYDYSYRSVIQASGGVMVDSCAASADSYKNVVHQILDEAKKLPAFQLQGKQVKDVVVKVDGAAWNNFTLINGNQLEVNGLNLATAHSIDVSYLVVVP
ncbi:hypothetical protein EBU99_04790 [bacterium]|nr:hypothetical protein [bacterium]